MRHDYAKGNLVKKYLITGLITLLPIAVTIMIIGWLFRFFTTPLLGVAEAIVHALGFQLKNHEELVTFVSRVLALVLLFGIILLLGYLGRKLFFEAMMRQANRLLMRIPFIKGIYRISRDVTKAAFAEGGKPFKSTVLIPFPHSEAHTLGFLTGDAPAACKKALPGIEQAVFIPTAPHPLQGYIILAPKKSLVDVNVSIEEAFKFLLACGAVHPEEIKKP